MAVIPKAGQQTRFHSYQMWARDASGGVSHWDLWADFGQDNNTGPNHPYSSGHTNGAQMLMGDGSVRFLASSTDIVTLRAMASRSGGEVFTNP